MGKRNFSDRVAVRRNGHDPANLLGAVALTSPWGALRLNIERKWEKTIKQILHMNRAALALGAPGPHDRKRSLGRSGGAADLDLKTDLQQG